MQLILRQGFYARNCEIRSLSASWYRKYGLLRIDATGDLRVAPITRRARHKVVTLEGFGVPNRKSTRR